MKRSRAGRRAPTLRLSAALPALALCALAWSGTACATPTGHGAVKPYSVPSKVLGATRTVWVYTPPGYAADGPDNDLLLAFDGAGYQDDIPLPRFLDSLIVAQRLPPTVAVLVDNASGAARIADLGNRKIFADFVATELVPWVHRGWKVSADPHRATVTGSSAGGLGSAFLALKHPELFGNVLSQSGAFWRGAEGSNEAPYEYLAAQFAASPKLDVRFFLDVGSTETRGALGGAAPSILEANRRLRDVLQKKGYVVQYTEVPGGVHAPETWRVRLPEGLVWSGANPGRK